MGRTNIQKENKINTRELVLSMLVEIFAEREFSHLLLRQVLEKYDYLPAAEKAFIKRLTEGTVERRIQLDFVLNQFSKVPVNKMKPLIRALLRMSVYQILYMDSIPDSAVCNEAVKLAEKHKFTNLKGFVNGVLRNIAREKAEISYPDFEKNPEEFLSVTYSMPLWLVKHFTEQYGVEAARTILEGLLKERPVTIRMKENLPETEKEDLKKQWEAAGIEVSRHPYLPYAYICRKVEGLHRMEGFQEGKFTVQDVSSMLVAENAGLKPGMTLVDVCAAPGGKATHGAEKLQGTGRVIARDVSDYKVDFIQDSVERQRLSNVKAEVWNATEPDEALIEAADVVFCDAPCSGLGVMGKKRDIKYRLSEESMKEVEGLQKAILDTVWQYVKKGGILMYSTCTINKEENQHMVDWFVKNHPFHVVSMKEGLPVELREAEDPLGLQLLPGVHPTDGFFIAKLQRNQED